MNPFDAVPYSCGTLFLLVALLRDYWAARRRG